MPFFPFSAQAALLIFNVALASIILSLVAVLVGLWARRWTLPTRHGLFCIALVLILVSPLASWVTSGLGFGVVPIAIGSLDRVGSPALESSLPAELAGDGVPVPVSSPNLITTKTHDTDDQSRIESSSTVEPKQETVEIAADTMPKNLAGTESPGTPESNQKLSSVEVIRTIGGVIALVWTAVAFWLLAKLVRGLFVIWQLRRSLQPITDVRIINAMHQVYPNKEGTKTTTVFESPIAPAPLTLGLWRSVIVMPEGLAESLNDEEIACVLAHEVAHVTRHDTSIAILQQLAGIGFWWNPLLRHINRQIGCLRERICDDHVVKRLGDGLLLAEAIVKVAEWSTNRKVPIPLATTLLDDAGDIEQRITRLMKPDRTFSIKLSAKSAALIGLIGIVLATIPLVPVVRAQVVSPRTDSPTSFVTDRVPTVDTVAVPQLKTKIEPKIKVDIDQKNRKLDKAKSAVIIKQKNTLTGRIVDKQQQGIGGAEMLLVSYLDIQTGRISKGRVIDSTIADSEGNYSFKLLAEEIKKQRFVSVWAKADGYVARGSRWSATNSAVSERKPLEISLAATAGTWVDVLDPAGNPLAGVRVIPRKIVFSQGAVGDPLPPKWEVQSTGTTGVDGKAHMPHVVPGSLYELVLIPPGNMGSMQYNFNFFLNVRPAKKAPHFTLRLPEMGSVKGQLVVAEGFALPKDLQLTLQSVPRMPPGFKNIVDVPIGADGKFSIDKLAVGSVFVPAFLSKNQPLRANVPGRIEVKANQETQLKIPVAPGIKVYGRVQKSDTKENVKNYGMTLIYGQTVSNRGADFDWLKFNLVTDAEGRFQCIVPPGPINLRCTQYADGYRAVTSWLPRKQRGRLGMKFEIPDQDSFDLGTIELVKMVPITGQVVDLKNERLIGWSVYGFPKIPGFTQSETMNSMAGVETDKKGTFKGSYPETYPPAYWRVSHRVWKTRYEWDNPNYAAKVISHEPFVLQVDTSKEWQYGEQIPYDTIPLQERISPSDTDQ
ncbi:M56 family metallopeptidase [Gimesia aquarii]|uniref:Regulatory protein BlaR1 n=1 Tax=Gimesia aquarii TaxID=2527964 RepID=A0A517W0S3_9PLAN|nr:M56 family metallopeptidase [Gimesia aquarii]QDT98840.1 Regulatory protein BlaR1 [Gimesia aquarii]